MDNRRLLIGFVIGLAFGGGLGYCATWLWIKSKCVLMPKRPTLPRGSVLANLIS